MTASVSSAQAAGRVFDFRSFLLTALQTNQDVVALVADVDPSGVEGAATEPATGDAPADDQWVAWPDATAESAWVDSELTTDWSAAAERLGWRV